MSDSLMAGRLEERLRELRQQGLSFERIAVRLYTEGQVDVSSTTLRKWAVELGIEAKAS